MLLAVSMALHHWLDQIEVGITTLDFRRLPISWAWRTPSWLRLRCVEQSPRRNPGGSPVPGAMACRKMNTRFARACTPSLGGDAAVEPGTEAWPGELVVLDGVCACETSAHEEMASSKTALAKESDDFMYVCSDGYQTTSDKADNLSTRESMTKIPKTIHFNGDKTMSTPFSFGKFLSIGLMAIAVPTTSLFVSVAQAQDAYPNKPIKFVVPYPPGGVSDNSSRAIADRLGKALGANMVVENKAGAASTVASNYVARSAPDGYTLYAAPVSIVINPILQGKVEYDPRKDFTPISLMMTSPFILQTNKDVKANNLKELIALVKANPDKYSIGTSGMGSINHLAAEYFIRTFGLKMAVIHYKGGMPAAQDMIGGQTQMMFSAVNEAMPMMAAGRTKGMAVSSAKRVPELPDLPTVDEAAGIKGFDAVFWLALMVPANTPAPVVSKLESAMQQVGADAALRKDLLNKGVQLHTSNGAEVRQWMNRDEEKWGKIIRELNLKQ